MLLCQLEFCGRASFPAGITPKRMTAQFAFFMQSCKYLDTQVLRQTSLGLVFANIFGLNPFYKVSRCRLDEQ